MAKFTDAEGREWAFTFTMRSMKAIQNETGHNLTTLLDNGLEMYADLHTDALAMTEIVAVVLKDEMQKRGITVDELFDSIRGDAVTSLANAFNDAFCDFIPSHHGKILRAVMAETAAAQREDLSQLEQLIASRSASNSPESSASTRGNIPSENSTSCTEPVASSNGTR